MAYLNRALAALRSAVNSAYPRRDKASDGWIGDEAHQNTSSDHNPDPDGSVDAWDMDVDLRSGVNDAAEIEMLKGVFQRHPSSRYWIHNREISHRNDGWKRLPYKGKNPHDKHVHWNSDESREDSTAPWILGDDDMTKDQAAQLSNLYHAFFAGGPSCGTVVDPGNGRAKSNSLVNKADELLKRSNTGTPVTVDASAVATALATNQTFLGALAKAINDDSARRMAA